MSSFRFVTSVAAAGLLVTGCGSKQSSASAAEQTLHGVGKPAHSTLLVNASRPPYVNALAVDPADGSVLIATNRGLFRIAASGGRPQRIAAHAIVGRRSGSYGNRVSAFAFIGRKHLIGSGHPNGAGLPPFLGVMTSSDGGRTWRAISRVGFSDLHVIVPSGKLVYAFDTVLGGTIVTSDGGKTFRERQAPAGPALSLAIDPADANYVLGATADSLARSTDGGNSWRRLGSAAGAQLAWSPRGLVRATADGTVSTSNDRGVSWKADGRLPGSAAKLVATPEGRLYAAMLDGAIEVSADDGRSWKELAAP